MASNEKLEVRPTGGANVNPVVQKSPRKEEVEVVESVGTRGKYPKQTGAQIAAEAAKLQKEKKQVASAGSSGQTRLEKRKAAQAAGQKEFEYDGKMYDTRWGGEVAAYKQSRGEPSKKTMVAKAKPAPAKAAEQKTAVASRVSGYAPPPKDNLVMRDKKNPTPAKAAPAPKKNRGTPIASSATAGAGMTPRRARSGSVSNSAVTNARRTSAPTDTTPRNPISRFVESEQKRLTAGTKKRRQADFDKRTAEAKAKGGESVMDRSRRMAAERGVTGSNRQDTTKDMMAYGRGAANRVNARRQEAAAKAKEALIAAEAKPGSNTTPSKNKARLASLLATKDATEGRFKRDDMVASMGNTTKGSKKESGATPAKRKLRR